MLSQQRDYSLLLLAGLILPLTVMHRYKTASINKTQIYPKYCNYSNHLYRGSTNRDVLILSADSFSPGLELAIKTLRSTGCLCRIVILASRVFRSPSRVPKIYEELGVELISNCTENKGRKYIPHMLRFEYELLWLQQHEQEVDRVFHADAYDVLFQKDPFSPEIHEDRLLFVIEPHCIHACGWNSAWLIGCYGEKKFGEVKDNFIICSGSIIGGVKPYIKLLQLMTDSPEWAQCYGPSIDQPILNVLVWSGIVRRAGILYDITGCNGNFMTMQWCMLDFHIGLNEDQQISSLENTVPSFVHQYNRIEHLTALFYQKCHMYPLPITYNHNA